MTQIPRRFEAEISQVVRLDYLLYLPPGYDSNPAQRWPVILYLHGGNGRGDDLELVKRNGIPKKLEAGNDLPFIVLSPQCPANSHWTLHAESLNALLNHIAAGYQVDENRVYLTGASLGAAGTWMLAGAHPEQFAAAAPISGRIVPLPLERLRSLPIWVFHGEADDLMPVSETHRTVDALRAVGAHVKLTIYPSVGHNTETITYDNPDLYDWFLSHKRP